MSSKLNQNRLPSDKHFLSLYFSHTNCSRAFLYFKTNSKMRILVVFTLLLLSNNLFSQPWQDALKSARESYLNKSYDKAVSHYQDAQKLAPKNIDLSVELAQSLYKAEQYEAAEKLYQKQINKNKSNISTADIHRQVGDSRMHQKKYDEAIESYKNSLRMNPRDEVTRHNLAKAIKQKQSQEKPQEKPKDNPKPKEQDPKSDDNSKNQPPNSSPNQPQENQQSPTNSSPQEQQKKENPSLSDKRTQRLLEELTEKEKETKRNMNSKRGENPPLNQGVKKDW